VDPVGACSLYLGVILLVLQFGRLHYGEGRLYLHKRVDFKSTFAKFPPLSPEYRYCGHNLAVM
jgi:hypothetical protein